jgi:hypothetical protein
MRFVDWIAPSNYQAALSSLSDSLIPRALSGEFDPGWRRTWLPIPLMGRYSIWQGVLKSFCCAKRATLVSESLSLWQVYPDQENLQFPKR